MVKPTPHHTNRFSILETSTVGSMKDMLTPQSPVTNHQRTKQVMPEQPPPQPSKPPFLVCSTTLRRGIEIPSCLSTLDSNTPMSVEALIDSGVMGLFINIEYVRLKNIWI